MSTNTIESLKVEIESYLNTFSPPQQLFSGTIFVSLGSDVIINKGYGMANYELNVPNTEETKFRIGSITKQFTAVAVLLLVESGLLHLDQTLDHFIPDYPNGSKITVHHLLTHSSGIYNYTQDQKLEILMRKHHTVEELIERFKYKPLDFEPDSKYAYSNSGYILLGYIIERVTGKRYEEYIQETIFDKLQLKDTGYDSHIRLIKNRVSGYDLEEQGIQNCEFIDSSIPYAAGALYSTVGDLHKWNTALFGGELLTKENTIKMMDKHIKVDENAYYGYGLSVWFKEFGKKMRKIVSHDGGIPGFSATNNVFPEDNLEIIILSNLTNQSIYEISHKLREIIFDSI